MHNVRLMPTPKPGQIRCPTCHKPTPPAAFCTQCGAAIPASAMPRPRGMGRDELEARSRGRRPGEGALRRGVPLEDDHRHAGTGGYVPFVPEPEDVRAVHEEEPEEPAPNVDNAPEDVDLPRHDIPRSTAGESPVAPQPTTYMHPPGSEPAWVAGAGDEPYGAPEDAYPYSYEEVDDRRRRGPGVLPIIGFIGLCVLALGVGAALASVLGGGPGIGQASATPSASESLESSVEPTDEPTPGRSSDRTPRPDASDGPIAFPDGAQLSIQPCGSNDYDDDAVGQPEAEACDMDSNPIEDGEVWAFIVFDDTPVDDTLTVQLMERDEVVNEVDVTIESFLGDCGCSGLINGAAHYVGLFPGDYRLVLQRNGEFADSATFTVED